ncbi:hypothetical protein ACKWTF_004685 [Chironomus riparius]
MAPKSEQKSKKKKKLTDEEKKALRTEKQQKILQDQIEREDNLAKLSHKRSGKTFFKVAENFKINSLAIEKSAAIKWSHHRVTQAENEVEKLTIDRQDLFDHLSHAQLAQAELIKYMKDLFRLFQSTLQDLFEQNRKNLVDDFYAQKIVWERLLHEGKRSFENFAHEFVSRLQVSLKDQKEKLIDDKIAIRAGTVIQCERIYSKQSEFDEKIIKELDDIYKIFIWIWPKERNERYQVTLKEYNEIQAEIEELEVAADKAEYESFKLENLLDEKTILWTEEVSRLRNYCDYLEKSLINLRTIERNAQNQDSEKLKAVSNLSSKVSKHLQKNLKTLENILMLMKVCAKYETIQDRIRFFDQPLDTSESSNNFKSFNTKLSQKSLNFSFRNSSILTIDDQNSACIHKKKLKCNSINNQSCLKKSVDSNKREIDGHERTSNVTNNSASNPLSFLQIYSSPDFNAYYPNDNEIKFTDENNPLSAKYPSLASSNQSDKLHVNELLVDEFYRKMSIIKADCLMLNNYKIEMSKSNEQLRKLLTAKKHEFGVRQNLQKLRLNSSPSVGSIFQFSHHIPQIQEEIFIRKCRSMHFKV